VNEPPDGRPGARSWLERFARVWSGERGEPRDRAALVRILRDAERRDVLGLDALAMIEGALAVGDMQVRDIMVPRAQMVVIEADEPPEKFVGAVVASGHSRFPVIGDNRDEVVGILFAKDLLTHFARNGGGRFGLEDAVRPAVYIPESKRLDVLLREFRASRNHMAIVVDEYGGVSGLVTIEDVLEQIVGEIDDEHDTGDERLIKAHSNGEFTVKAHTPVEDFDEYFGSAFDDEESDTIGGVVVRAFARLPSRLEQTTLEGFRFTVVRADKRRVHLLRVRRLGHEGESG
jgi:magnesium and cobalt transporter